MEFISYAVLLLVTLAGYSAGVTAGAGRKRTVGPVLGDLLAVCLIWIGALWTREGWEWNRWAVLPIWLAVAVAAGILLVRLRMTAGPIPVKEADVSAKDQPKNLWKRWKNFSHRMGGFQSRILLSLFYFLVVFPFAFILRLFGDPLKIKPKKAVSFWGERKEGPESLMDCRRQF
ncbi:MAG: hypothetical protein JXB26_09025 [Candidatus Aminicenantes bacterium]|nr:hypothetical protein [Candidatus Aminicenantes bacterium]